MKLMVHDMTAAVQSATTLDFSGIPGFRSSDDFKIHIETWNQHMETMASAVLTANDTREGLAAELKFMDMIYENLSLDERKRTPMPKRAGLTIGAYMSAIEQEKVETAEVEEALMNLIGDTYQLLQGWRRWKREPEPDAGSPSPTYEGWTKEQEDAFDAELDEIIGSLQVL